MFTVNSTVDYNILSHLHT